jgi:trimeric autotransporter adhesin
MPRSTSRKTALEQILDLTVTGGIVTVRPYTKTSTTGKPVVVGAASRGAPGPKYGVTNPGGSIRNTLSTGRQQNEANAEVASAMGSANPVTVGASTLGRTSLNYTATAKGGVPPTSAAGLAAGARAAAAGASKNAAASQAASIAAATAAATAAAKTASAKSSKPFVTYPKSTSASKPFTTYPKSASSSNSASGGSSSSASKLTSALRIADAGRLLTRTARPGSVFGSGHGRAIGDAVRSATSKTASQDAHNTASETASRDAHNTASATARKDAEATAHRTASATAHATASATARKDAEATIKKAEEARETRLSMPVAEILDLQLSLRSKGYPVKLDGRLSTELITLARAYLKVAR